ncbi:MAG: putative heparinase superfamily protein [Ulvibacter sp.]|jgi:uncharacterized heparinase superfamily protein
MWTRIRLYYATLKHLKWKQVRYQLFYRIRNRFFGRFNRTLLHNEYDPPVQILRLEPSLHTSAGFHAPCEFNFLNLNYHFYNKIDWNFADYGKLWTYNLNYFEFLLQENISQEEGLRLIHDFIDDIDNIKDGLEPYPLSLRIIFWLRFLQKYNIGDERINRSLFAQLKILSNNIEYHLLGNHLLENGFALLFGAYYFNNDTYFQKAKKIISEELEEQILGDGAHFELSPMYHQIILYRLLDSINLVNNNAALFEKTFSTLLIEKAQLMLGWLKCMTFNNGRIPLFNDSADNIAPESKTLFGYASRLGISFNPVQLNQSGYRRFDTDNWTVIFDVGKIGADYIPGHGHCDIFNFSMHCKNQPFIIDTGTSTYNNNAQRQLERSTKSHNTVQVNELEQSEIWSAFRVGERAVVNLLTDTDDYVKAVHNGFKNIGVKHCRTFRSQDNIFYLKDEIEGSFEGKAYAYFHFHKDIQIKLSPNSIVTSLGTLTFGGHSAIRMEEFQFAQQFNLLTSSKKVVVEFRNKLESKITVE